MRALVAVFGLALAQWAIASASLFSYFMPIFLAAGISWTVRRRLWAGLVLLVLTSPLSLWFAWGLAAYGNPRAHMMSVGRRESCSSFIDRHTRLPVATSGCFVDGNEWVRNLPYNSALHLVTAVLGPPRGYYVGPIPTEQEAREALALADAVDWRELAHDKVTVRGRGVTLERGLGPALLYAYYRFDPSRSEPDSARGPRDLVHVRIWKERVLLIEMRDRFFDDVPGHVAVMEVDSGRLFGHFPGPDCNDRFPSPWSSVKRPSQFAR